MSVASDGPRGWSRPVDIGASRSPAATDPCAAPRRRPPSPPSPSPLASWATTPTPASAAQPVMCIGRNAGAVAGGHRWSRPVVAPVILLRLRRCFMHDKAAAYGTLTLWIAAFGVVFEPAVPALPRPVARRQHTPRGSHGMPPERMRTLGVAPYWTVRPTARWQRGLPRVVRRIRAGQSPRVAGATRARTHERRGARQPGRGGGIRARSPDEIEARSVRDSRAGPG